MSLPKITLVTFGQFDYDFVKKTADKIKKEFKTEVNIVTGQLDLSDSYDYARQQYNADILLKETNNLYATDETKTIGLFNIDIFIPIFTYIFGQAMLNGKTGIVSVYRLNNEPYGIKTNNEIILDRFSKEIIHELGHTFGLIHCIDPACVMRSGTYVEEIDQKNESFCIKCKNRITHF